MTWRMRWKKRWSDECVIILLQLHVYDELSTYIVQKSSLLVTFSDQSSLLLLTACIYVYTTGCFYWFLSCLIRHTTNHFKYKTKTENCAGFLIWVKPYDSFICSLNASGIFHCIENHTSQMLWILIPGCTENVKNCPSKCNTFVKKEKCNTFIVLLKLFGSMLYHTDTPISTIQW